MEVTCECGRTRFTTPQAEPVDIWICYCDADKMSSGGACRINVFFDAETSQTYDAYLNGLGNGAHLRRYVRTTGSGHRVERVFCGECAVTVAIKPPASAPRQPWVAVPAPCIVGFDWERLKDTEKVIHCWTSKAILSTAIPEGIRHFAEQPT
ncbi:hypothetical protein BKA67DRAFT_576313 [Truncatella angustata]|uniref:CENP-V/GFA domain-containing protein n=1 Tax=Truncatella angustata TaxID=152316 RepID=A0A9P8UFA5_9PEZI|nr:uncharacterized protein BKA67DRAFT_576313 [Truncatella angustata]KAH6648928.1 hypothetical protein BKA67DRAFT_576313 [Truncatella angustata]